MIDHLKNNKELIILSTLMGSVVIISNYLVQFPFKHFNLNEVLTYGAFTYPISFLITDVSNQKFGNKVAKKVVYFGFFVGVVISIILSFQHFGLINARIGVASGIAFLLAQLLDVKIFDILRKKIWYLPPLVSSVVGSIVDTFLFFSIAFYGTGINWISLGLGDLSVKLLVALIMLIPFRLLIRRLSNANGN
mgnify:FL=1